MAVMTSLGVAVDTAPAAGAVPTVDVLRAQPEPLQPSSQQPSSLQPDIDTLLRAHRVHSRSADAQALRRAYRVAHRAHHGQLRKSGEPYITHPLAVACILADLGSDTTTLIAALLHDTVEDTHYTLGQLSKDFGSDVAHLVDGVTKLDKVHFGGIAEAETIRKMILAAGRDIRVFVIKLADRLHNMRTLGAKSVASRRRIATVTRDILVPLAGRLGVQLIKRELEDLVLASLEPETYALIHREVTARAPQRLAYVTGLQTELAAALRRDSISAGVLDRPRHYASIAERLVVRPDQSSRPAGPHIDLHDDPRVIIVVSGGAYECYAALGVVHGMWRPVPGRFVDFIATPKFNLYKSLHTAVIGPEHRPVDILIRTEEMHRIAEVGIAAQCREAVPTQRRRIVGLGSRSAQHASEAAGQSWQSDMVELDWLQRMLDWQGEASSEKFLESLRFDLADQEMSVFTSAGKSLSLPVESTPVDVAYALGPDIGDRCIGARVNGQLAPLSSPLAEGNVVEVLTSQYAGPDREWLDFVRSSRAHVQIQQWFAGREVATLKARRAGKRAVVEAMVAAERVLMYEQPLVAVAGVLGFADVDALYAAVAENKLSATDVVQRIIAMVDGQ